MSDLFHDAVPDDFILKVFSVMNRADHHQFQVLTKRPERVLAMDKVLNWTPNIWMGTSVESRKYICRIDALRKTRANIKFLSLEPLLGPLDSLDLSNIHWAIVGGESGPHARPMKEDWVISIREQCKQAGVPFFFKQWGGTNKKKTGRLLEGRTWDDMPRKFTSQICHSMPLPFDALQA
jgi:protein gp37